MSCVDCYFFEVILFFFDIDFSVMIFSVVKPLSRFSTAQEAKLLSAITTGLCETFFSLLYYTLVFYLHFAEVLIYTQWYDNLVSILELYTFVL